MPTARSVCRLPGVAFRLATLLVLVGGWCGTLNAARPLKITSQRASKQEAIHSIPFDELSEADRARVVDVVSSPSIFRRMPIQLIRCDPDLYQFMVRYPEVIVNIWDLMGITKVTLTRTGPSSFSATDGVGTQSNVQLVYASKTTHLMYAEGTYEGPLLKRRITGRCVLLLKSGHITADDNRDYVTNRLDVFIRLNHVGAEILAKTLHPLVGRAADYNFSESTAFLGRVSRAAETNGDGMQRLVARLTKVDPAVRERFARVTATLSGKAVVQSNPGVAPPKEVIRIIEGESATATDNSRATPLAAEQRTVLKSRRRLMLRR